MITIDQEARKNSNLPINFDFMAEYYKTNNGLFVFVSPYLWTIEKNLFYLLNNSDQKKFDLKYRFKPSYLSFDEYGTIVLDKLLMYVNGILCVEDFSLDTIMIPKFQAITDILEDKFSNFTEFDNLIGVNW